MGRQVFDNGVLVERWDDATQTYTGPKGSRPYTPAEMPTASPVQAIRDEARAIADNDMTAAEAAAEVKRLARAVEALAEQGAR